MSDAFEKPPVFTPVVGPSAGTSPRVALDLGAVHTVLTTICRDLDRVPALKDATAALSVAIRELGRQTQVSPIPLAALNRRPPAQRRN